MSNVCHLLVDPPAEGAWNMAVDEALLDTVAETGMPTLRFYQWKRPTLSLGYFQRHEDRKAHAASLDADIVRRLSGGGAIVHDRELTYSLVLPIGHRLVANTQALYQAIHQAIMGVVSDLLLNSETNWQPMLCANPLEMASDTEPFLCFSRRSTGDVLLASGGDMSDTESHKIVGSAQRRRRGAILQHGSILLSRSDTAPELAGLCDLAGISLSAERAMKCLQPAFATALDVQLESTGFSDSMTACAQDILVQRYGNSSWLKRR